MNGAIANVSGARARGGRGRGGGALRIQRFDVLTSAIADSVSPGAREFSRAASGRC